MSGEKTPSKPSPGSKYLLADRVPDGLQLEERPRSPTGSGSPARRGRRASRSRPPRARARRASPSAPVRSIAFTSMCEASHGASSARWPVRRLTTPPGTSRRRQHLGELDRGQRPRLRGERDDGVAARRAPARCARRARAAAARRARSRPTTPVGSGTVKLKYGPATGFDEPSTCASLSAQPAYQTKRSIDALDLARARSTARRTRPCAPPSSRRSGRAPGRGCTRSCPPIRQGAARRADGVANVLARGARDVLALRLVRAPRLGARESAADEELVGLLDGAVQPCSQVLQAASDRDDAVADRPVTSKSR